MNVVKESNYNELVKLFNEACTMIKDLQADNNTLKQDLKNKEESVELLKSSYETIKILQEENRKLKSRLSYYEGEKLVITPSKRKSRII